MEALVNRADELKGVEIIHGMSPGPNAYVAPEYQGIFHHTSLFIGPKTRKAYAEKRIDYIGGTTFSRWPDLFAKNPDLNPHWAFIQVSEPDEDGMCSFGNACCFSEPAARTADRIIAQINPKMPTLGGKKISLDKIDYIVPAESGLYTIGRAEIDARTQTIADYVADLRAPTPSAAAELAVFDYSQFEEQVRLYSQVLNRSMERKLERLHFRLEQGKMRLKMRSPERQLADRRQRLADIESFLERRIKDKLEQDRRSLEDKRQRLELYMWDGLKAGRHRLALDAGRLDALSPLKKLSGGYGFVTDSRGNAVRSIGQTGTGDRIGISVRDGRIEAQVTGTVAVRLPESEE